MKFSYNWLKEISGTKKTADELIDLVMLRGFELEEKIDLAKDFENFVIGLIKKVEAHPDADRLRVAQVDLGEGRGAVQIVCGAPNLAEGQKVPVAMPGAILPQSKIEIKKAEMRGVESNGMICAEDEIGLGKDHEGIMVLDESLKEGTSLTEALNLKDQVLDFDILPNRSHDCLSYQGLAREVAVMEGRNLDFPPKADSKNTDLNTDFVDKGELLEIEIKEPKLCPRYIGAVLKNIKIGKSPEWMQARLVASGMEPINNVVDITNYVMLEVGSPLHAFDFDQVADQGKVEIVVRKAETKEKLELLSDIDLELDEDDLLITNGKTPLALAGIKGGKKSGINSETNKIVLEAANFDLLAIRKARQRHALATESQSRFEKGISPVLAQVALERAIELLIEHAGAELVEAVDCNKYEDKEQIFELEVKNIEKLLGEKVELDEALKTLENLGFEIKEKSSEKVKIKVPYWRLDIEGPADFIEEIGRIKGYEKIKEQHLMKTAEPSIRNLEREMEWRMKDYFNALGFDEIISYSFYGEQDVKLGKIGGEHFELENPNNDQQTLMRKSLLPGLIQAVNLNQKHLEQFNIFEIGRIYSPEFKEREAVKVAGAGFDNSQETVDLFYSIKEKISAWLGKISDQEIGFELLGKSEDDFYHPARSAKIILGGKTVGRVGEVNPRVAKGYKLKKQFVVFDLDFSGIFEAQGGKKLFVEISKFPYVERDLAVYVDPKTEVKEVEEIIKKEGGEILRLVEVFDIFEDKQEQKKSFAFHLKFGKVDATLRGEDVDQKMEKIMSALEGKKFEVRK